MNFDSEGHIVITPHQLFQLAIDSPTRLVDHYLIRGTPNVFPSYAAYGEFLHAVSERIGVHPSNLSPRGSCQIGFSIAPRVEKVWMAMDAQSDLDLAIVDAAYYEHIDQEVIKWEERNRAHRMRGPAAERFESRQGDRFYNCCRVDDLPSHLCAHHAEVMEAVSGMKQCGSRRTLKAFIYRDWYSLRSRYPYDLRKLRQLVPNTLSEPGDKPLPRLR